MKKALLVLLSLVCLMGIAGCTFSWGPQAPVKDQAHGEHEKQTAAAVVDLTGKVRTEGTAPEGRDIVAAHVLSAELASSLGAPVQKIDATNDQAVVALQGQLAAKEREFAAKEATWREEKAAYDARVAKFDGLVGSLQGWLGLAGTAAPILGVVAGLLYRGRQKFKRFATAQVIGTSQVKAVLEQASLDPAMTQEKLKALLHRDTINRILRTGAEAAGMATKLEPVLQALKDVIPQHQLEQPLVSHEVLLHRGA